KGRRPHDAFGHLHHVDQLVGIVRYAYLRKAVRTTFYRRFPWPEHVAELVCKDRFVEGHAVDFIWLFPVEENIFVIGRESKLQVFDLRKQKLDLSDFRPSRGPIGTITAGILKNTESVKRRIAVKRGAVPAAARAFAIFRRLPCS